MSGRDRWRTAVGGLATGLLVACASIAPPTVAPELATRAATSLLDEGSDQVAVATGSGQSPATSPDGAGANGAGANGAGANDAGANDAGGGDAAPAGDEPVKLNGFGFGIMQPVSDPADIRSPERVAAALRQLKALGTNVTIQQFPPEITPAEWQAYLDVALAEGVDIIGRIGPTEWNPDPADLSPILNVLAVVGEHPALYGFIYLHEPWEVMTTPDIEGIYQSLKQAHPALRLGVIWSGSIVRSARGADARRLFTENLCDICLVNMKAFQNDPEASQKDGLARLAESAAVIQAVDPTAELWSSVQVWAPPGDGGRRGFRVPSPEEMTALFCTAAQSFPLHGFLWAAWSLPLPGIETLSSNALATQRAAIGQLATSCAPNT